MDNVLKKIFEGVSGEKDEDVHNDFIKYSKGVFGDRYLVEGKNQKDKITIKTSAEFANFFVETGLTKAKKKLKIKGAIITTLNIKEDIKFEIQRVKQFQGIKQLMIDTEIEPDEIISLIKKYPKAFFALTFAIDGFELKIKEKAPKSGKPKTKNNEEPKADFCSLKTTDREMIKQFFFDCPEFKDAKIKHVLEINQIDIPEGETDPVKMRENAIRKGKIKRIITLDGKKKEEEISFVA